MSKILELHDIRKDYIQGRSCVEVLKGVDFELKEGEFVGILGASGSGKSTLLHICGLLESEFSGNYTILGKDIAGLNNTQKAKIRLDHFGFVYQFHYLIPDLTAVENVATPGMIKGMKYDKAIDHALELLADFGIEARAFNYPGDLSGGEQQRVAIARAMFNKPKVVFADEPTGSLDPENAEMVVKYFVDYCKKHDSAIMMVTHNTNLAQYMDKIYKFEHGKITIA